MNPPTGRPGRVLALGLLVMLGAVIWLAVASPLLDWYADRAASLTQQSIEQQHIHRLVAALPGLRQAARQSGQTAPEAGAFLTGATDAIAGADLEERLQKLSSDAGVTLSSAEALGPQPDGPYRRIQLHIAVTASWPALIGLLQTITNNAPAMLVDDLAVNGQPVSTQPGDPPLDATFTVIAFRAPAPGGR